MSETLPLFNAMSQDLVVLNPQAFTSPFRNAIKGSTRISGLDGLISGLERHAESVPAYRDDARRLREVQSVFIAKTL